MNDNAHTRPAVLEPPQILRTPAARYATAFGFVFLATLLRWPFADKLGSLTPYLTFYVAVAASAVWCGVGPALFAIALSALAGSLLYLPPEKQAYRDIIELVRLAFMLAINVGIALIGGIARNAKARAQRQARLAAQATEALRSSEARLRLLTDHAPVLLAHWDLQHRFKFANRPYAARFGLSPEQIVGRHLRDVVGNRAYAFIQPWIDKGLRGEVADFELRVPYETLGTRWMHVTYTREFDDDGRVVSLIVALQDISPRKRAEVNEERLLALMDHNPSLVFLKDETGKYVYLNSAYEQQFVHTKDWLGKTDFDFWPAPSAELFRKSDADALESGRVQQFLEDSTDTTGTRHCWLCYKFPFTDSHNERFIGGIGINITDRVLADEALLAAKADAEAASRAKDHFLAVLSHELRTPLMPVVMTASLLAKRADLPPDIHGDIRNILRNAQLEARLIDDLLDLTRISRGKMRFDFRTVDAHLVIRAAADICSQGDGAPIVLHLRARHHWVDADAARLQQVIWNLLNNARKFTPLHGEIAVHTSNTQAGRLLIEVRDTGAGIGPDVLPRLFTAFEQGDIGSKRPDGLGLGLTISRAIVESHNGSISAHSEGRGKGAAFTVEIPAVPAPAPAAPVKPAPAPLPLSPRAQHLRVLLIEDHESTRNILRKLLASLGHDVQAADCVTQAKTLAAASRFDLVVSDLGLPDGTGQELMAWLREHHGLRGIALSGYGMEDDIRTSLDAGFAEHLIKPINLEQFEAALTRVLATGQ